MLAPAETRRFATRINECCARAMRDGSLERILRSGMSGTTISRRSISGCWPASTVAADHRLDASTNVVAMSRLGGGAAVPAVAASGVARDHGAVVSVDGAGRRPRRADRHRTRLRRAWSAALLIGYVELMRGTPILLQLFVLYYGMAAAIRLPAFVAALLGLALNYAAYESEIYRARARSGLDAVSSRRRARSGLSERQVLTLVRGPQAFRLALAPMTNDFVALLKDSSLVSVLTVARADQADADLRDESRQLGHSRHACARRSTWLMSLPLAALARRLERRWKAPTR